MSPAQFSPMPASEIHELEELLRRQPQAWFWTSTYAAEDMRGWYEERGTEIVDGDWWTCDPDTSAGDLVFAYVAKPTSKVVAVKLAASDARQLNDGDYPEFDRNGEPGWVCDWRFVGVLADPLPFKALSVDGVLQREHAVQMSFNGRSFRCSTEASSVLLSKLIRREKKARRNAGL